jgi:chromosome segregation ATPase
MDKELLEFLQNMQQQMNERFNTIDKRFNIIDKRLDSIDKRIDSMDKRIDSMDKRIDSMDKRIDLIQEQVTENTHLLKALEENAKVTRAEQEKLSYKISEIEGDTKSIKKDLGTVELVTANNWSDIVRLKAIK